MKNTLLVTRLKFCLLLLFCLVIFQSQAAVYVRYNLAGYDPVRPKVAVVMADASCTGTTWRLKNSSNSIVLNGTFGASIAGAGAYMPLAFNYQIDFTSVQTVGNYTLEVDNATTVAIKIACKPYQFALSDILRTIRVRRSGSADAIDHALSHTGDASCATWDRTGANNNNASWTLATDGKKVDMLGGYYDAGDYIKFTTTNAYLTYFMLRSYEAAPELFDGVKLYSKTSLDDILDEAKWGLDYLMKTMPDANEFIIQVGGYKDHNQGTRLPENDALNGKREALSCFSKTQMGTTVAALALGSKIFASKGMTTEATAYKNMAIQIYNAAKASSAANAWWQGSAGVFYADNTNNDNMELAAIELYKLTNTASYLTDAQTFGDAAQDAGWASWGDLNIHAHNRVYPYYNSIKQWIDKDLTYFNTNATIANNLWGLPHESTWGSNFSQFEVGSAAINYKANTGIATYDKFAYNVGDYIYGNNPWGWGFIATKAIPNTITTSYAQIYKLTGDFPLGEIAEGPDMQTDHQPEEASFSPAFDPNQWFKNFNTTTWEFFEQPGDYVCMETTIGGLADGLYFLTMASKNFCTSTTTAPTITFNNVTKNYGDAAFTMTATSNSTGALTYSITSGSSFASINSTTGQVTILGAGTVTVQVSQAASGTYAAATKTATLTINKASLTATADAKSRVYNTANPGFTITYTGFVNSETASVLTSPPTVSTTATTTSNVGTYPITLTGGAAANYTITLVNGTLTVTQATPTLTYTGPTSGTVSSVLALTASTNSTATLTYSVANGTGTATLSGSNLTLNTAGTVTITISVAATTNYTAASVTQTITINNLTTPTIAYGNVIKNYGDASFAMTATSNSSGAMTYSITSGGTYASINATTGQVTILGAGTVTVQVSQAASGTYVAATKIATLTINKASLTATADAKSRVYNTANPAFTITYTGFVNSESVSVITVPTASTTAITTSNVGAYPITLTGGAAANYTITLVNGTLSVTQATPTLTYTGPTSGTVSSVLALTASTNSTATPTYSVSNGTGTATLSGSNLTLNTAGTVTVTVSVAATTNYTAASVTQTITINNLTTPTIAYGNVIKNYGDASFAMTATSNSTGALTYSITSGGTYASINATTGQVTILGAGTVTVQVSQAASGTYAAASKIATLTINKASLTAIADAKSRVYNTANPAFTITYTGFVNSETASVLTSAPTASTTATTTSNVGTYSITLIGGTAANYTITLVNGTLTVTQATPTLTYTGPTSGTVSSVLALTASTNSTATLTYSVANGTGTATLSGSNLTLNTAGTVTVTVSVAATTNYTAASVTQTITINNLTTPTITFGNVTKNYGDASFAMAATSNSTGALTYGITSGGTYASINATTGQVIILGAGTVTVQVSQAASGTYAAATKTATLTINKASLTATADAKSRVYNTANPSFTITYTGFVNSETVSVLTSAPAASTTATISSSVGTYPITLTGGVAANYSITLVNGALTITQATPTLTYTGPASGTVSSVLALTASTNSTATPTYSVANGTGTATLSGSNLTLNTAGTVTITISVAATTNYTAASVTQIITISNLTNPSLSFVNSNITATYGDAPFTVNATSNSPGATTYSIISGGAFASINSTTGQVTILGAGNVIIQVSQASSGSYAAATQTATLTINKATPTLAYIGSTSGTTGNVLNVSASTTSDATPTFAVAGGTGTATLSGTNLTLMNQGTVNLTIAVASTSNYNAASVVQVINISALLDPNVTINFATTGTVGETIPLNVTTNSTGVVTYTVTNGTGSATLIGNQLTLTSVGTVTVTVNVASDGTYGPATYSQVLTINNVTGVMGNLECEFKLYPSVTESDVTLEILNQNFGNGFIIISDMKGIEMNSIVYKGESSILIKSSEWPSGVYLIKLQTDKGYKITKFVKQ